MARQESVREAQRRYTQTLDRPGPQGGTARWSCLRLSATTYSADSDQSALGLRRNRLHQLDDAVDAAREAQQLHQVARDEYPAHRQRDDGVGLAGQHVVKYFVGRG